MLYPTKFKYKHEIRESPEEKLIQRKCCNSCCRMLEGCLLYQIALKVNTKIKANLASFL